MPGFPIDREGFGEAVLKLLRRSHPERRAELSAPMHLVVDGRHLGLDNLLRLVNADPGRAEEIVETYLARLLEGDALAGAPMPLALARPRIMPRIQPCSIFEHLDPAQVAHVPFVNETVVVFVLDLPQMTVSLTTEQMVRWGLELEELEAVARTNLARYAPDLPVQIVESAEGGRAAILSRHDGYDAARLLLEPLHRRLARELRGDFYVATPARDMFVAFTFDPPEFVDRLRARVAQDFRRLPYPITDDFFLVTMDGVAGTRQAA
ncbi:MAG TPA: DUF1444 family protein [Phycisphaerales bacterium]|nr:DUF1444 family protein [Phycisphaerales bacterium]HMP38330.1 DUF1444 family protein [Phycisphaerales bacterium]